MSSIASFASSLVSEYPGTAAASLAALGVTTGLLTAVTVASCMPDSEPTEARDKCLKAAALSAGVPSGLSFCSDGNMADGSTFSEEQIQVAADFLDEQQTTLDQATANICFLAQLAKRTPCLKGDTLFSKHPEALATIDRAQHSDVALYVRARAEMEAKGAK